MLIGAVMVPHPPIAVAEIGRGEEKKIQPTLDSFSVVSEYIAEQKPDTVILTTPHAVMYRDWFNVSKGSEAYGDFSRYRAKSVSFHVDYDEDFTRRLDRLCQEEGFPAGTAYDNDPLLDQGTMVPLYFIRQKYDDFKLVRIGLSGLPLPLHYRLGMLIQKLCMEDERRYLIVASGDLSHCEKADGPYGYHPEGPEYDKRLMADMGSGSFGNLLRYEPAFLEKAQECGHRSFTILGGILDRLQVAPQVLSHEATFGVGYGFVIYSIGEKEESRAFLDAYEESVKDSSEKLANGEDPYIRLAYQTIQEWITHHKRIPVPENLPEEMRKNQAGVFVSVHEYGELRGCIGTISSTCPSIAEEIIQNAISACSRDPRFDPVRTDELQYLEISVDVLKEAEEIPDASMLDVKRYGVIVSTEDGRRGLLLPNLDGVDTVREQIAIALRKGGISEAEPYTLERFEVIRHE